MNGFDDNRPNPDELLASLKNEEEKSKRGKLKIFFGMCAGVGKTYTMLQTAHAEKLKGNDIIIGYVETHNRKETAKLVAGFELIPRKTYEYKSTPVYEMDLDSIIARKPHVVLVDELAHTNAPGSRHAKRYQDVQEILESGINVYTTLNVQHLESRSDTVAQITGIIVRETLPDEIFENADEVELIDLTSEELLQRLSEGKVYTPERSKEAVENFFRKGNITALREMALRIVADRVDRQLHDYMQNKRIRGPWKSGLHFLVAVGPSPFSGRLMRWAKTLSYSMGANIQAVYVETMHKLTMREQEQLDRNINLAKQLGIKFRIVTHNDIVKAVVGFAQKENISHIIVGKPHDRTIFSLLRFGNFVNRLIRYSGNIDVYILGADNQAKDKFKEKVSILSYTSSLPQYLLVILFVVFTSLICYFLEDVIGYQVVSFMLLFVVSILALFFGTGPVLLAAILSSVIWDYFFIPPQFTLHIEKPLDLLMLAMFFFIALLNGILTSRVRRQEKKIRIREERTNALYQLIKELSTISGYKEVTHVATHYIRKYFQLDCTILIKNELNQLEIQGEADLKDQLSENAISVVNWVFKNSAKAGKYTSTLPSGDYTYYPLKGSSGNMGVIVVKHPIVFTYGEEQFWDAYLSHISGKYEREFLREVTKKTYIISESEKLYNTLFNSISHELRIPIATIMAASDNLKSVKYPEEIREELYSEINTASIRLNRLVGNLLNMSRLESGRIIPRPDWCDVHDLGNSVSESLKQELQPFNFLVIIPPGMPLVRVDFGLTEQILHNLVLNATQHAPAHSSIRLKLFYDNGFFTIQVMDRGKGFPESELRWVFDKFYRGKDEVAGGTGLGLSIVKGFTEAQKGTVTAGNRKNGGAIFEIKIPVEVSDISTGEENR
ncbi:MAG: two-component sensor histidine kinase [Bacteroidetes bacterium GWF2_42_66]|nr:MAG: two-component sensor histidine kinase [Bacteroidetes bacterium GWA2_42_15]OFY00133.1 MAG: two-component sensor histidine kinase [Bacteroidetes bacterium GWE2_42_39]OFY40275.1 MAG: two-component sensor histidine kinase [Bacteroidetes bacterium GWF2_42_66]HBL73746.1 sensor histidine kinase KdpD [Prolixibacteraceae bacterium]HCR91209.1 sensor histidine kinase KdpD [Prolixibacteraceae bacterium]